jgi:hypothetical protein
MEIAQKNFASVLSGQKGAIGYTVTGKVEMDNPENIEKLLWLLKRCVIARLRKTCARDYFR